MSIYLREYLCERIIRIMRIIRLMWLYGNSIVLVLKACVLLFKCIKGTLLV